MYLDGKRVLFMTENTELAAQMEPYFRQRYNLIMDPVQEALDVLHCIGEDNDTYELAILDEGVAGLATTSQLLKTIKDQEFSPNVLYLSTLHEIVNPDYIRERDIPDRFLDRVFRQESSNEAVGGILSLYRPIFGSYSVKEVCMNGCRSLVENLDVDCAVCVVPFFEENPPRKGTVTARFPEELEEPYTVPLRESLFFDQLVDYYKPVHVPDLAKEPALRDQLMAKFSSAFRSALIVPMVLTGRFLGYFGMFNYNDPRMFRLQEIDHALRLVDFAAAAAINLFIAEMNESKESSE